MKKSHKDLLVHALRVSRRIQKVEDRAVQAYRFALGRASGSSMSREEALAFVARYRKYLP